MELIIVHLLSGLALTQIAKYQLRYYTHNWTGKLVSLMGGQLRFYGSGSLILVITVLPMGIPWSGFINT
jgi:hypothetical protein